MMTFHNKSRPATKRVFAPRREPTNTPKQCCIPRLLGCPFRPSSVTRDANHHKRPFSRLGPVRMSNKRNSVSAAVQTTNCDDRGNRLSKVSWNSQVDVRYIGSDIHEGKAQKVPLHEANLQKKTNEELKNVVHLKIKIPKDVLNLTNDDSGHVSKRLENEWNQFNLSEERREESKNTATECTKANKFELDYPRQGQDVGNQNCTRTSCSIRNQQESSQPFKPNLEASTIDQMKLETVRENEPTTRNAIVETSTVHNERDQSPHPVGIPVKQPGKSVCDSQGCACKGSTRNDRNLEKVRQSFDMTESELSVLEKTVHNNDAQMELKIQTEYGSVNVISHDPDCKCKICETFGSHDESQRKHRGRSDEAAVISKRIIRVHYNGDYRNIITHTEECGCDICSNIEEHSYKLMNQRASIVSTHRGDVVVKNKGVCGCKNCKTVEMSPHVVDVETMLSRSSSHVLDQCYYSDATIPSMQSFPREGLTATTDDQAASFSSPPSINSSDLSGNSESQSPSGSNVNTSDNYNQHKARNRPGRNLAEFHVSRDIEPVDQTKKGNCSKCEYNGDLRVHRNARKRMLEFVRPSSAKSSPAGLNKHEREKDCQHCKFGKGKNKESICEPITMKSRFSTCKSVTSPVPIERAPITNGREIIQSHNADVSPKDPKADTIMPVSSYNSDHITLEDLIRDLIQGKPGMQKDKVYTVTLGEFADKAYTKIHIVDCSLKSGEARKKETKGVKIPNNGDASHSNVFFIETIPVSTDESQGQRALNDAGDCQSNSNTASTNDRSSSSPACLQDVMKPITPSTQIAAVQEQGTFVNTSQGIQDIGARRAFKLSISLGKRVASLFRQRGKKETMSNHTISAECEVSQDHPKRLKTFTLYEGAGKPLELVKIDVKPRYFTLETSGEEPYGPLKQSPILCLLEKNSNTQVVATLARS